MWELLTETSTLILLGLLAALFISSKVTNHGGSGGEAAMDQALSFFVGVIAVAIWGLWQVFT